MPHYKSPYSKYRQFRTMSDIFQEYRKALQYGGLDKPKFESRSSYGESPRNFSKTEYSREPSTAKGERENNEQKPEIRQEIEPLPITEQGNMQEKESETSSPRQLPVVELGEKKFFLDERLQEIRNIENPLESISFKELDLVPEKTEDDGQYENRLDVKHIFDLTKYENKLELGQTDTTKRRPSQYGEKLESRW